MPINPPPPFVFNEGYYQYQAPGNIVPIQAPGTNGFLSTDTTYVSQETSTAGAMYSTFDEQSAGPAVPWHLNPNVTFRGLEPNGRNLNFHWDGTESGVMDGQYQTSSPDPMPTLNQPSAFHDPGPVSHFPIGPARSWTLLCEDSMKQGELALLKELRRGRKLFVKGQDPMRGICYAVKELHLDLLATKELRQRANPHQTGLGSTHDLGNFKVGDVTIRHSTRIPQGENKDYGRALVHLTSLEKCERLEKSLAVLLRQHSPALGREYKFPFGPVNHDKVCEMLGEWLEAQGEHHGGAGQTLLICPLQRARPWAETFDMGF
jgi:hypothetical protein